MIRTFGFALALGAALVFSGCPGEKPAGTGSEGGGATSEGGGAAAAAEAKAKIEARSDSKVSGMAVFRGKDGKVHLTIEIEGAEMGPHAVHVHEHGDCSAPDGTSAGGHWNPTGKKHGKWGEGEFHLGDIGNIEVGEDGKGSIELTTDLWSLGTGDENDVVGKSIIVHAGADDFTSQPSGAAGARIGCGVIEAKDKAKGGDEDE